MALPPDGKFKAGDRVRIGTWEGVLPELVRGFFSISKWDFNEKGWMHGLETFGSLMQFIERPKPMRKVKVFVSLYRTNDGQSFWGTGGAVVGHKIVWQGEIEVDDV